MTGDAAQADGVLQDKPAAANRAGSIVTAGRTLVKAGGAFEEGEELGSDASGRAVNAATSDIINGTAIEPASAANEIVWMNLMPKGAAAAA